MAKPTGFELVSPLDLLPEPPRPRIRARPGAFAFGYDDVEPSGAPEPDGLRAAVEALMERFSLRAVIVELKREP